MTQLGGVFWIAQGRALSVRRAVGPTEVGRALEPGVIVETDLDTAEQCGAFREDSTKAAEALEACDDPAVFSAYVGTQGGE
ncbi:MAG: hypothetical protein OXN89_00555 [Bryobacterales bacterium]|nr:hypothetical protein [Bryobacterales bacterium]